MKFRYAVLLPVLPSLFEGINFDLRLISTDAVLATHANARNF